MKPRRVFALTALAAVAMIGAATSIAAAADTKFAALDPTSIRDYSNYGDVLARQAGTVTVDCPAGTSVVAVGAFQSHHIGSISNANNTSAVVTVNATSPVPSRMAAVVSCAPSAQLAGTINVTGESHKPDPDTGWYKVVTCPAGMRAFGGGGYFRRANGTLSTDGVISQNSLSHTGSQWLVRATNITLTDTLVVTACCANASSSTRIVDKTFIADVGGLAGGYANCPPGYLPISGGALIYSDANRPTGAALDFSLPVRGGQFGWYAAGNQLRTTDRLTVRVLCGI